MFWAAAVTGVVGTELAAPSASISSDSSCGPSPAVEPLDVVPKQALTQPTWTCLMRLVDDAGAECAAPLTAWTVWFCCDAFWVWLTSWQCDRQPETCTCETT